MQPFAEAAVIQNSVDHTLMVSMFDDHLVLCAPEQINLEMTELLVVAAGSAVASGSTVMIDLDPDTASDDLVARRPLGVIDTSCAIHDGGPVSVLAAGCVRLSTRDAHWTIDMNRGRLCRSENAVEPQFVSPEAWIRIQALWVAPDHVTALTLDGTYLTTVAAWTIHEP